MVSADTVGAVVEAAAILENSATTPFLVFQPGIGKKLLSTRSD
jgi:hypothetical protein